MTGTECPGCGNDYSGDNLCMESACQDEVRPSEAHECGYLLDSFACRIRHVNVNVENLRRGH